VSQVKSYAPDEVQQGGSTISTTPLWAARQCCNRNEEEKVKRELRHHISAAEAVVWINRETRQVVVVAPKKDSPGMA
jgi:hypothetical protein